MVPLHTAPSSAKEVVVSLEGPGVMSLQMKSGWP